MNKKNSAIIIMIFLSLICLFSGISIAFFDFFGAGMTNNVIQTGRVVFSYSDANGGINGINIENAFPISDDLGKIQFGPSEYFDFTVSSSTTNTNLMYEIVALKDENSTLAEEHVKLYLTSFEGDNEVETPLTSQNGIPTYNMLKDTDNTLLTGKTLYYGDVKAGEVAYGKKFRLRMWVTVPNELNYDFTTINDKKFSVRVNVAATSTY